MLYELENLSEALGVTCCVDPTEIAAMNYLGGCDLGIQLKGAAQMMVYCFEDAESAQRAYNKLFTLNGEQNGTKEKRN